MTPDVIQPVAAGGGLPVVTKMQDPKEKFYRHFQVEVTSLQDQIERLSTIAAVGGERKDAADSILAAISRLSSEVADASDFVPSYDQRNYAQAIKTLTDKLNVTTAKLAPRSRFQFKSRIQPANAKSDPRVLSNTNDTATPQDTRTPATSTASEAQDAVAPLPPTTVRNYNDEIAQPSSSHIRKPSFSTARDIAIYGQTDLHILLPATASHATSSGRLTDISGCVVDMSRATGSAAPFANLALKNIERSLVLAGNVDGPVHVTSIRDSILVVSARQVRIHECHNMDVYFYCGSRPIIEDCSGMRFAPLPKSFESPGDDSKNQWDQVDDFKWLKAEPSPNWSVLPVDERLEDRIWSDVVPGEPARSSSTGDYRSVIDDLTVEIQKLKDELKKYKQSGPDLLKRDKLFEIKVHGLPKRKKRELEATLRDFASGLSESASAETSSARKKSSRNHDKMYSVSGSMSKHASSSSGSNWKHADSAYASASTGPNTSGTSITRPSMSSRARSSEQKVESYLKDIPEGLYPRHMVMTDKEKKKLVVRRLEHLFTGKITGQAFREKGAVLAAKSSDVTTGQGSMVHQPPSLAHPEASREARIAEEPSKKSRSRDNDSTENSNGDQNETTGNVAVARTSNSVSPPDATPAEQRPTRPLDLDPHRKQVPSENMDYIRHLGLVPPELLPVHEVQDVASDADGWVYLNLLCSLAQLHIVNVTPDFIRTAVTEKSTKFQLSHDGRKIRWRGGCDGTRFSSDSSGDGSRQSPSFEDTDGSNEEELRKKSKKVQVAGEVDPSSAHLSSKHNPTLLGKTSVSPDNFHYKPMFVHQSTSGGQSSMDDTSSSIGPVEDSNLDDSRWGNSGSGTSLRKKRRRDGAIIYYNGAPFCTDLSGDPGDTSPTSHMASSGQQKSSSGPEFVRPDPPQRTTSGSALRFRPLSDNIRAVTVAIRAEPELTDPYLTTDDSDDSEIEGSFLWSDSQQFLTVQQLEPSGLGGVVPEDHFMVVCGTKRPKANTLPVQREMSDTFAKYVVNRISSQLSANPLQKAAPALGKSPLVEIDYVSGRIKRFAPMPLPPPSCFFPPFSTNTESSFDDSSSSGMEDDLESSRIADVTPMHHEVSINTYPENEDMTSGDEEGGEPDNGDEPRPTHPGPDGPGLMLHQAPVRRSSSSAIAAAGTARGRSKSTDLPDSADSSNATVDAESGYKSSSECS
ncbi:hypothetical protein BN1708_015083 [Verticillium longisporum]|uniref:C-CAP/cofactor C-like domain-containing protein n=1 Tax=Verticillium longisporum TaxID=100787 RepID=A0A0G4M195_VERLO|nr:hypothetical protein BN1708_015083 [Verticillium longisporum]